MGGGGDGSSREDQNEISECRCLMSRYIRSSRRDCSLGRAEILIGER
jgi:hypothetical protein